MVLNDILLAGPLPLRKKKIHFFLRGQQKRALGEDLVFPRKDEEQKQVLCAINI